MFKKITHTLKQRPLLFGGIGLAIIIVLGVIALGGGDAAEETMIVRRGQFLNEVSASGKVIAAQSSNLGFDQSGRVSGIYAKVGDSVKTGATLASIENGAVRADITQKQAALAREQAKLAALRRGTRTEQLVITEQKYTDASSALVIALRDAYLKTEDAILSDIDTLFNNGGSVNPDIDIRTEDQKEERSIGADRFVVTEKLFKWKDALAPLTTLSDAPRISSARSVGIDALTTTQQFIARMSVIANNITTGNSGLSVSEIDSIRSTINTAGQSVSAAASAEQTAYASWTIASNNLSLEKSGSAVEDITAQEAQVKAAEADLANAQAQLRKTLVIAPFDGIVTKMDVKIGEISSPTVSDIAMIGVGLFEIESFIPEVSIARLSVGNPASITLDAYGSDVSFDATVIAVDPAETVRDGVSTYKTTLRFADADPRIKPGMTANIRITAESKSDVITVPKSVITDTNGTKTVRIKVGDSIEEVIVSTGSMTALGQIEIISGLSEGDVIILPPLAK
ncbi:MAG: efflux RND transporter periplasmic adaptor subunit [Candidatus Pacebacteria bacterium]|nr:efflux RND transporter periplasmic adaptor subunit [Candidatus Paceibacterota bacterium]